MERRVVKEEREDPSYKFFGVFLFCLHTKRNRMLGRKRKGKEELKVAFNVSGASERNTGEDIPAYIGV